MPSFPRPPKSTAPLTTKAKDTKRPLRGERSPTIRGLTTDKRRLVPAITDRQLKRLEGMMRRLDALRFPLADAVSGLDADLATLLGQNQTDGWRRVLVVTDEEMERDNEELREKVRKELGSIAGGKRVASALLEQALLLRDRLELVAGCLGKERQKAKPGENEDRLSFTQEGEISGALANAPWEMADVISLLQSAATTTKRSADRAWAEWQKGAAHA
jgi:hypothetical protein